MIPYQEFGCSIDDKFSKKHEYASRHYGRPLRVFREQGSSSTCKAPICSMSPHGLPLFSIIQKLNFIQKSSIEEMTQVLKPGDVCYVYSRLSQLSVNAYRD